MLVVSDLDFFLWWQKGIDNILLLEVEVLEVHLTIFKIWLKWRFDLLGFDVFYVHVGEPRMGEDFMDVIFGTESLLLIFIKKLLHNILKFIGIVDLILFLVWENDLGLLDLREQDILILVKEWSHSNSHFIDEDT